MDDFEVFEKYHSRSVKELFVTIQRRGNISLNRAAFRAMGSPEFAELLFNRSKRLIGIRPTKSRSGRTVPIRKQGQSESYLIGGLTFTKEFDIDSSVARRFVATMQGNMLVVDLNSPSTDATGPRLRSDDSQLTQEELFSQSGQGTDGQDTVWNKDAVEPNHPLTESKVTETINKDLDNALTKALQQSLQLPKEQQRALLERLQREIDQGSKKVK
jgi:hypothetical protein